MTFDPADSFDDDSDHTTYDDCRWDDEDCDYGDELYDSYEDQEEDYDDLDDGQPTMYEEYQDLYGGDDWDHGQFDE